VFGSIDLHRKAHAFPGHALYKGPKTWGLRISKDAEFNIDLLPDKDNNLYPAITFFRCILSQR
jgi:hypothetical protein